MPPKAQLSRDEILNAVMNLIEHDGWEAVSARSIARALGISTQPIYREFGDMQALRDAAINRSIAFYVQYVRDKTAHAENNALAQSTAYVSFATEHSSLFRLIYESRAIKVTSMKEMSHTIIDDNNIIETLAQMSGLDTETVYEYHFIIWMALHGLASITATNKIQWAEQDVEKLTLTLSRALINYYKENDHAST